MKKKMPKLSLQKETVRHLNGSLLAQLQGGSGTLTLSNMFCTGNCTVPLPKTTDEVA